MNIIDSRRSVNFFDSNKSIEDDTFNQIMDLASLAPSSFNLQPWRVIAVKSKEEKERLLPLAWNQPKVTEASHTLIIIGDKSGFNENTPIWNELEKGMGEETTTMLKGMAGQLYGSSEELKSKFAHTNASLFTMSLMYSAQLLGVESHTMSGVDYDGIKKEFNLKDSEEVILLLSLGYKDPSKDLYPRAYRKTGKELFEII